MREVQLTRGVALVDDGDYGRVNEHKWHVLNIKGYNYIACKFEGQRVYLHRLIMGAKRGDLVYHKNHDVFDNRRCNLWVVPKKQEKRRLEPSNRGRYYDRICSFCGEPIIETEFVSKPVMGGVRRKSVALRKTYHNQCWGKLSL